MKERDKTASPVADGLFTLDGEPSLLGSECGACHTLHFPRTDTCPYCGVDGPEPCSLPRTGTLWAWTAVTAPPPGYLGPVPYGFGIVELAGRIRIVTRLTETDPGSLQLGQPMQLVLTPVSDPGDATTVSWAFAPGEGDRS